MKSLEIGICPMDDGSSTSDAGFEACKIVSTHAGPRHDFPPTTNNNIELKY